MKLPEHVREAAETFQEKKFAIPSMPGDYFVGRKEWMGGVEWLLEHISKQAPVFDHEAHLKWLSGERLITGIEPSPQANARWQFDQDQKLIWWAWEDRAAHQNIQKDLERKLAEAHGEISRMLAQGGCE